MTAIAMIATWVTGSVLSAELFGYWLHRLLHSGAVGFLSRSHMRHHLLLYGPLQEQRSNEYQDATDNLSLGNIGTEWLIPAGILIVAAAVVLPLFRVRPLYEWIYFATTLSWSFLMFSKLHDLMHVEGFWLERNRVLRGWFVAARTRHDIHHFSVDDNGLMNKNFGIGFFFFDRLFGTFAETLPLFNRNGYQAARERFKSLLDSY